MEEKKEAILAKEIYKYVGDIENINKIEHCMTRVRIDIKDNDKVDIEALKKIKGVLGVVEDETLQIIVGPGIVNKVAGEMVAIAGVKIGEQINIDINSNDQSKSNRQIVEEKANLIKEEQKKKNNTPFKRVLKSIANIFVPLIPAFVGAGLIGGIGAVLTNMLAAGSLNGDNWYTVVSIMTIIRNGIFSYLAIYAGINSAAEFGATKALGGVVGGITMLNGMIADLPLPNIFTGGYLSAGQGGIIGVIFAVWLLSLIEKNLRKVIPDAVDIIVTPTLSLLAIGLLTIFIIMPIAGVVSNSLIGSINWVLEVGGAFSGFVLGFAFLPLVMLGLHQILTPIHAEMINSSGMTLLLPILAMAGAGQVGAAFALWLKCSKNKELITLIKGALPVGILGIGEPLIYGVTLPLGRPFITACIGGGIGGAVLGAIGGVGSIAIGPSGVALIPLIANGLWLSYVLGLLAAYIGGFIATYFFGISNETINP